MEDSRGCGTCAHSPDGNMDSCQNVKDSLCLPPQYKLWEPAPVQSAEEFCHGLSECPVIDIKVEMITERDAAQRQAGREEAEKLGVIILRDMEKYFSEVVDAARELLLNCSSCADDDGPWHEMPCCEGCLDRPLRKALSDLDKARKG